MATENLNLPVRTYQEEFKQILQKVFEKRSHFADFFGGGIEAIDGVANNETAFKVKTSDIPGVIGNYDTGANVAFGSGTANSTRFGDSTEIIYTTTDVPYTWNWAIHEGIDRFTVNNKIEYAVADRLEAQAQAKVGQFNAKHSAFISSVAGETENLADYTDAEVLELFNKLAAHFVNIEAIGTKVAKVNTSLYNAIIDHPLTVKEKNSTADTDSNTIVKFKGFVIDALPDAQFQENEAAYAYIQNVGKAFTGINTARTIESEDFDGVALQGAGLAGEFIPDDNKKAVVKVTVTPAG